MNWRRPTWTGQRLAHLVKFWNEGRTATEIAKQLGGGITREAVLGKIDRLRPIVQLRTGRGAS